MAFSTQERGNTGGGGGDSAFPSHTEAERDALTGVSEGTTINIVNPSNSVVGGVNLPGPVFGVTRFYFDESVVIPSQGTTTLLHTLPDYTVSFQIYLRDDHGINQIILTDWLDTDTSDFYLYSRTITAGEIPSGFPVDVRKTSDTEWTVTIGTFSVVIDGARAGSTLRPFNKINESNAATGSFVAFGPDDKKLYPSFVGAEGGFLKTQTYVNGMWEDVSTDVAPASLTTSERDSLTNVKAGTEIVVVENDSISNRIITPTDGITKFEFDSIDLSGEGYKYLTSAGSGAGITFFSDLTDTKQFTVGILKNDQGSNITTGAITIDTSTPKKLTVSKNVNGSFDITFGTDTYTTEIPFGDQAAMDSIVINDFDIINEYSAPTTGKFKAWDINDNLVLEHGGEIASKQTYLNGGWVDTTKDHRDAIDFEVSTFAQLPSPSNALDGQIGFVKNATGTWGFGNKKKSGLYVFNSGTWEYGGNEIRKVNLGEEELNIATDELRRFSPNSIKNMIMHYLIKNPVDVSGVGGSVDLSVLINASTTGSILITSGKSYHLTQNHTLQSGRTVQVVGKLPTKIDLNRFTLTQGNNNIIIQTSESYSNLEIINGALTHNASQNCVYVHNGTRLRMRNVDLTLTNTTAIYGTYYVKFDIKRCTFIQRTYSSSLTNHGIHIQNARPHELIVEDCDFHWRTRSQLCYYEPPSSSLGYLRRGSFCRNKKYNLGRSGYADDGYMLYIYSLTTTTAGRADGDKILDANYGTFHFNDNINMSSDNATYTSSNFIKSRYVAFWRYWEFAGNISKPNPAEAEIDGKNERYYAKLHYFYDGATGETNMSTTTPLSDYNVERRTHRL